MRERILRCFARGSADHWEAMCIDLDIVAEGASLADVTQKLEAAIVSYVHDAMAEDEQTARRLLRRRAPLAVRLKLIAEATSHFVFRRRRTELHAGFDLPCPA